jgi:hypothetical protein
MMRTAGESSEYGLAAVTYRDYILVFDNTTDGRNIKPSYSSGGMS